MSRIDELMNDWNQREQHYQNRYGPDLQKDRAFAKVKLKAWKRVLKDTRGLDLSNKEKDDRNILKSQIRSLERRITPNPVMRLMKRIVEQGQDIAVAAWGFARATIERTRYRTDFSTDVLSDPSLTQSNDRNAPSNAPTETNRYQKTTQSLPPPAESQQQQQRSTPIPGPDAPQASARQNQLQQRRLNKQRTVTNRNSKGQSI